MRGLPSNLSIFRNEFNKFNNARARKLDSIYHMTLNILKETKSATMNIFRFFFLIFFKSFVKVD